MARFDAEQNPTFQRARRLISAITQANPAEITTSFDHDYETGDIVRIYVPRGFGMTEIDKMQGTITVTATDTFTINIDTTGFSAFSIPGSIAWYIATYPSVLPVGEISANLGAATQNTLPH